jgi:hypothetical protein
MSILRDEYIIEDNRRLMTEVWKNVMAVIRMFYRFDHLPLKIFGTDLTYYKKTIPKTHTLPTNLTSVQ